MAVSEVRKRIIIALVIILTAVIIVTLASRAAKRRRRARFSAGSPAAPRQKLAARDLSAHLSALVTLGNSFTDNVQTMDAEERALVPMVDSLPPTIAAITASLADMNARLEKVAPTKANLLGFYGAISGSDQGYLQTATAIENAGHSIHQGIDVARGAEPGFRPEGTPLPNNAYERLGAAGVTLIQFAREIRGLLISTHRLGAALDVE